MPVSATETLAAPVRRRLRTSAPVAGFRALPVPVRVGLAVAVLTSLSVVLRTQALGAAYWIDEGISVGIASHPLVDIPELLRQDGSPPLYYLILGVWMRIVGPGEVETHLLSVVFAALTVPAAFLVGRALFGERAGWYAALLAGVNPFVTFYAQETRMYALVTLLGVVVTGAFALAFVQRRRAWLPVFAVALALLVYAHNWGLFMVGGTLIALAVMAASDSDRRGLLRDALLAYGAAALAYAPWVPSLLFQANHTGAPWSNVPTLGDALDMLGTLLAGTLPAVVFGLGAVSGLAAIWMARAAAGPRARTALAVGVIFVATFAFAWLSSQVSPAWAQRYLSLVIGPLLLLGAAGLARAGVRGVLALALVVVVWAANPRVDDLNAKSNVRDAAALVETRLGPGDLVVATHPEQVPTLHVYLPDGLRWATAMGGLVADPEVMDWRDALGRLERARPAATTDALVRTLEPGQHLLLVQPIIRGATWRAPWTSLVRRRAEQWERILDGDPRLSRTLAGSRQRGLEMRRGVRTVLYERR